MYDDGTHGDAVSGNNIYSYALVIPAGNEEGVKTFTVTATNSGGSASSSPVTSSLSAWWNFEEANGNRIDATGNGNDLVEVNGPIANATGKVGNGADLQKASNQWLQRAEHAPYRQN
jgi:hypothetical protein